MNCQKCGTLNNSNSKFCIKCGQSLVDTQVQNVQEPNEMPSQEALNSNDLSQKDVKAFNVSTLNTNFTSNKSETTVKVSFMGYFFIILSVIIKPFKAFKEELNKFNSFKNSAILSLIVSGVATLINLITTMFNTVRTKNFDWSTGNYKTIWIWENLKELNYLELIGKNFLIYLGIILGIAIVYYVASLIVKKQTNFSKLLGISALSITPMLICSLILSPLLSLIWSELAMPIILVGMVYTIIILYETVNSELLLEGNAKYYFNLICFSIFGITLYYLFIKVFISSVTSGLDDILNMFEY